MRRFFALCSALAGLGAAAFGQVVLTDGNSTATIDPTSNDFLFRRGLNSWVVDDVDHLFQQWYWFRIGNSAERSIDTISVPTVNQTAPNAVNIAYEDARFGIDITFTLVGGTLGSGTADIGEIVRVRNLTNETLDFHLFEYDDFDAGGTFEDDFAERLDPSSIRQFDALSRITVGTVPAADRWQISEVPDIFDLLADGVASNLANATTFGGPGDLSFAFQWDRAIAPGGTFLLSKNKLVVVVPEPATWAAVAGGLILLGRRKGRK